MRICRILTIVTITTGILMSQVGVFGYFESEWDHIEASGSVYSFGYSKLRVDFESRPAQRVLVAGNVSGYYYSGSSVLNLLDFIPARDWKPVLAPDYNPDSTHIYHIPFSFSDTLFIDNLYLRSSFKYVDLTLGRQPVSLGTGYAWNPLDIFNVKDIVDPTYEQLHVTALRLEIPVPALFDIDIIYAPETQESEEKYMIQAKRYFHGFDITVNLARHKTLLPYWQMRDYMLTHKYATFTGGSLTGQVLGLGVWAEGIISRPDHFEIYELVAGMDYTFSNGLYIFGEYFRNSLGAEPDELTLLHYFNAYSGDSHSLMQDYFMGIVNYPLSDFIFPSMIVIANLNDNSAFISPQITWEVFENVQLLLWYAWPTGGINTEFGIQETMVRARINAYF